MIAPRLEINLKKIHHNARKLVELLTERGISVTGVTKAVLGSHEIAKVLLKAGVSSLGDSRIENIEGMKDASVSATMTLIRSPMLSQVDQVVNHADVSFNSELRVIHQLSIAAQKINHIHGIVLMVELGDLREGIMPADLNNTVREILRLPNIILRGLGTNLACRSGTIPSTENMSELSSLVDSIETKYRISLDIVSGGNSANLAWALSNTNCGRINNLRLGEAILLGREPLHRQSIDGLYTDAITLVAEVIESKLKPSQPWGEFAQTAFGKKRLEADRGNISQGILAIGIQDTDPSGLDPPSGINILGASSDHLIVESDVSVGSEITFQVNYSALVRAMTSPFVKNIINS